MRTVLDPLIALAGVRRALVIGADGLLLEAAGHFDPSLPPDSYAAQVVGWVVEASRAIAPLAWDEPEQLVLEGAHGAILLRRGPGSWVAVEVSQGTSLAELTIPLEAAAGRLERLLRGLETPNAPLPSRAPRPAPASVHKRDSI
ncbi:MAG: roadblock/LC7 domain-containing protein [Planctomycetes bacterium]|nr:roadblock/LC7 domain-containing protein [Planctomycetota bacterium]